MLMTIYLISVLICVFTTIQDNRQRVRNLYKDNVVFISSKDFDLHLDKITKSLMKDIFVSMLPFVNSAICFQILVSKLFK